MTGKLEQQIISYLGKYEWMKRRRIAADFCFMGFVLLSFMIWIYMVSHRKGSVLLQKNLVIEIDSCLPINRRTKQVIKHLARMCNGNKYIIKFRNLHSVYY